MLTLAVLDAEYASLGPEVNVQREIRAVVGPAPYVEAVRTGYAPDS